MALALHFLSGAGRHWCINMDNFPRSRFLANVCHGFAPNRVGICGAWKFSSIAFALIIFPALSVFGADNLAKTGLQEKLEARSAKQVNYGSRSAELAHRFLLQADQSGAGLEKFVSDEQIVGEGFINAFLDAVKMGQSIAHETPPTNKNFPRLLADSLGLFSSAVASPSSKSEVAEKQSGETPIKSEKLKKEVAADSSSQELGSAGKKTEPLSHKTFIHGGVRSLRSYNITKNTDGNFELGEKSSATPAYVELVYWNAFVTDAKRRANFRNISPSKPGDLPLKEKNSTNDERWALFDSGSANTWDTQARFGYTFVDKDHNAASAIAGSGDFSAEITLSKLIYYNAEDDGAYSVGLDLSYGLLTDSVSREAHHRGFLGPSFNVAFGVGSAGKEGLLSLRVGAAGIDTVSFMDDHSTLLKEHRGYAAYDWKIFGALEAEAIYPVGDSLFVLGARIYSARKERGIPSTWSLSLGYSQPIENIIKLLPGSASENK